MRRAAAAALLAAAAAGCGSVDRPPPPPPVVALGYGQEVAEVDADLTGAARTAVPENPTTNNAAMDLWSRAVRLDAELPQHVAVTVPGATDLRTAAHTARAAARALRPPHPDAGSAIRLLSTSAAALRRAADALGPRLPGDAAAPLERMRDPLPPG